MIGTQTKAIKHTALYRPLNWQIEPWRDKSKVLLLSGGAGGGKSRVAAEKIHGFCKKYPNSVGIGLRKAREFASKSVVFALKSVIGEDNSVRYNSSELTFYYDNGSKIFISGLKDDAQRQAIRSINGNGSADIIWGEEANAFSEDDHNELLARLRGTAADWRQIIYTTNPDHPYHWIKLRLIDGGEASVFYSKAIDNPYNPDDYADTLNKLTGVSKKRLRDGLWVMAEGTVYSYDPQCHLIDRFEIPSDWRRIRVIDFGYTNPFVCQWWAIDHDGRMYRYREIYHTQRTVKVHSDTIKRVESGLGASEWEEMNEAARNVYWKNQGEKISATICDHDAEDRATLRENGIPSIAAKKDRAVGRDTVEERLKIAGDGKPRMFFLRDSLVEEDAQLKENYKPLATEQEFGGYVYPQGQDGKAVKEEPIKVDDHGMDSTRYAAMYEDNGKKKAKARTRA